MYDFPCNLYETQVATRIADVFSTAEICGLSSDRLYDHLQQKVYGPLNRKYANGRRKHPQHYSAFARGYAEARIAHLYREHLEYCYLVDGELYSTHKQSKRPTTEVFYQTGRGHLLCAAPSGHVWKEKNRLWYGSPELATYLEGEPKCS